MSTADPNDPLIQELREQLSDNDVRIVEALNARLELVAQLKRVKEERGFDFLDPAREEWMLQHLTEANPARCRPRACGRSTRSCSTSPSARCSARTRTDYSSGSTANSSGVTSSRKRRNSAGSRSESGGAPAAAAAISSSVPSPSNSTPDSSITSSAA